MGLLLEIINLCGGHTHHSIKCIRQITLGRISKIRPGIPTHKKGKRKKAVKEGGATVRGKRSREKEKRHHEMCYNYLGLI